MKFFIQHCHICGNKIQILLTATTRNDIRSHFGSSNFNCVCGTCHNKSNYNVNEVVAESDSNSTAGGAAVGGIVGLIGGPLGAIIGATIGGLLGGASDTEEINKVNSFNNSI